MGRKVLQIAYGKEVKEVAVEFVLSPFESSLKQAGLM